MCALQCSAAQCSAGRGKLKGQKGGRDRDVPIFLSAFLWQANLQMHAHCDGSNASGLALPVVFVAATAMRQAPLAKAGTAHVSSVVRMNMPSTFPFGPHLRCGLYVSPRLPVLCWLP